MMKPIKTKQQMMGLAQIMDVAMMVCALLVIYGTIDFDDIGTNIKKLFETATTCPCGKGVCSGDDTAGP